MHIVIYMYIIFIIYLLYLYIFIYMCRAEMHWGGALGHLVHWRLMRNHQTFPFLSFHSKIEERSKRKDSELK